MWTKRTEYSRNEPWRKRHKTVTEFNFAVTRPNFRVAQIGPFQLCFGKKKTYFWTFECGSSGGYRDSPTLIVNGGVEAPSEKCSPSLAPTMRCRGQRFASLLSAEGRVCFSYLRIQDWSSDVYVRRSTIKAWHGLDEALGFRCYC